MNKEIVEQTSGLAFHKINKDSNRISGLAILRERSANSTFAEGNGRRYSRKALEAVAQFANGARAYLDHEITKRGPGTRSVKDFLGTFSNGRIDGSVVRGDLTFIETQKPFITAIAEQMPDGIGLSIHAFGPSRLDRTMKEEVVEDVVLLKSIDLVSSPASTINLFESRDNELTDEEHRQVREDSDEYELREALGITRKREKREDADLSEDERELSRAASDNNDMI